jgi:hypothetical protein
MLKPVLYLIILSVGFILPQRDIHASDSHSLYWVNMQSEYTSLDDLKPLLVNRGNQSIYLSPFWLFAQVERLNESVDQWEPGNFGFCLNGIRLDIPVELKPGEEKAIRPDSSMVFSHSTGVKMFWVPGKREQRPLEGRYRLVLQYTLVSWVNTFSPDPVYRAESPEFRMKQ